MSAVCLHLITSVSCFLTFQLIVSSLFTFKFSNQLFVDIPIIIVSCLLTFKELSVYILKLRWLLTFQLLLSAVYWHFFYHISCLFKLKFMNQLSVYILIMNISCMFALWFEHQLFVYIFGVSLFRFSRRHLAARFM